MSKKNKAKSKTTTWSPSITYPKLFWLFVMSSVVGLALEGFWCLFRHGHWESHVNTLLVPLCCIYGLGAVGCYIGAIVLKGKPHWVKFLCFSLIGAAIEFICGYLMEIGLHMRAWDYSGSLLNIRGYVNLEMTLLWGVLGMLFYFALPYLDRLLTKMEGKKWNIVCLVLSVLLALDLSLSGVSIIRWANRHRGLPPANSFSEFLDARFDDDYMAERFCHWKFIEP